MHINIISSYFVTFEHKFLMMYSPCSIRHLLYLIIQSGCLSNSQLLVSGLYNDMQAT